MTIDLRRVNVSPSTRGKEKSLPQNRMPLPVGGVMRVNSLLPEEEAVLVPAGWKAGDPIPENMADILADMSENVKSAVADEEESLEFPEIPVLVMPDEVPLESLPREHQEATQKAIAAALAGAKVAAAQRDEQSLLDRELQSGQIAGSVAAAVKAAGSAGDDIPIVNDLEEPKHTESVANGLPCRRCGHPAGQACEIEVTDQDKFEFVQSMLGLQPFRKTVEILGGRLKLTIRTLTPEELELVWKQVYSDYRNGQLQNQLDENERLRAYTTALRITAITGLAQRVTIPQTLAEWRTVVKATDESLIAAIWKQFRAIVPTESMYRLFTTAAADFTKLVLKLEANSTNPDFFKAV